MSAVLSLPQIPVVEMKVLVSAAQSWGLPSSAQTSLIFTVVNFTDFYSRNLLLAHSYFKPLPGGPSIILSLQVHKECDRGSSGSGPDLYHEGYGPAEHPSAKATSISTYYRTFYKFCKHFP